MTTKSKQLKLFKNWVLMHSQKLLINIRDISFVIESEWLGFIPS